MNIQKVNISQIKNSKVFEFRYNSEQDDYCLKKSIENGQLRPIVVDQEFEIVDGNKLFNFLVQLGYTEVYCLQINVDNYIAKRLELNLWSKIIDPIPFYKKLQQLGQDVDKLNIPFKQSDIAGWVEMLSWDWDVYKNKQMKSVNTLW